MAPWVVCFDPWQGLKPPVPALYPEWGENFLHCPGQPGDWQTQELAFALECKRTPPEIWLLAPFERTEAEIVEVEEKIKTVMQCGDLDFAIYRVVWRISQALSPATPAGIAGIRVDLTIDPADPNSTSDWECLFLLPLALRFLFEAKRLLNPQERKSLSSLGIRAERSALAKTIETLQSRINSAAAHVRFMQGNLDNRKSEESFFDMALSPCTEAFGSYQARPCDFGFFYRAHVDEHKAFSWLKDETDSILKQWAEFKRRIDQWWTERLRSLTLQLPSQRFPNQTPKDLYAKFQSELASLPADEEVGVFSVRAARLAHELADKHREQLVLGLRRRPSKALFLWVALLLTTLGLLFSAFGAHIQMRTPAYPWLWPAGLGLALTAGFALALAFSQYALRRALVNARLALQAFFWNADNAGAGLKDESSRMASKILLNRNLEIAERELRRRELERSHWEYHLNCLKRHFLALDGRQVWSMEIREDLGREFNPAQPETDNKLYFWRDTYQQHPRLLMGRDERRLDGDTDGRLAGIAEITLKGGS